MTDAPEQPYRGSRRFIWLTGGIVLAIAAYTVGWFYIGGQLEAQTLSAIEAMKASGRTVACDKPEARGFPFRLGLFCDRVAWEDKAQGVSVQAGALRTAAQVYSPTKIISEVDGPARLSIPGLPPMMLDWTLLHASARLSKPLPQAASMEATGLTVKDAAAAEVATATNAQAHMRTNAGNLDIAASLSGLKLSPVLTDGRALPELDGVADLTLADGAAWLLEKSRSLRNRSGTLRDATLNANGETGLHLTGPWSVDSDGRISGDFTLTIREPAKLAAILKDLSPADARAIDQALTAVTLAGGIGNATLPVKVKDGIVSIAFVTLGALPLLP
ncbi:MAG: DUF2125 domain-containing protein [Notoacmeibacter sp.]|nr:DUF2125 domain-containing protein [Notoacmeibacter sp.]